MQELTFTVALVPADASKVKYQNGVVAAKVAEAANGVGNLAQAITAGATFGPVVIYIDQNQQGLSKKATTKWGGGGCALPASLSPLRCPAMAWQTDLLSVYVHHCLLHE